MPKHTNGGTARLPSTAPPSGSRLDDSGDEVLAAVLIRMWALASGRSLRGDVPPDQLSPDELIAFWADDMTPAAGRHARTGRRQATGKGHSPPHGQQRLTAQTKLGPDPKPANETNCSLPAHGTGVVVVYRACG